MEKYALLRHRVVEERVVPRERLEVPDAVDDEDLTRVHAADYVDRVARGGLTPDEIRRIGFPWSPELVERSRRSAGGTLAASRAALGGGVGVNLAGGTHHAGTQHGEGFCVFNDAAVAIRALQAEGLVENALVVDCDVHQGNGTAEIFRKDPSVVTFSIHGANNYPFRKASSDVDVPLPDGVSDDQYLEALSSHLSQLLGRIGRPDLAVYVSGADPYEGDALGRLSVSKEGLAQRDEFVFGSLRDVGVPVAVVMAGGYAADVHDTVDIHVNTVRHAARAYSAAGSP